MARIIGIDPGSYAVKIAIYEGTLGRQQLLGAHSAPVPQPDDGIPDMAARIATLESLLSERRPLEGTDFGVCLPADWASIRVVRLPFGDRSKVESALEFEVENQVPFDMDDMILAHRILSVSPGDSRVLTALAARERIAPLLGRLAEVGADPKVLALDGDLLGVYAREGVEAVIDLGHTRTLISLCVDGKVQACRAITGGGRELTQALMVTLGIDLPEAETRKHRAVLSDEGVRVVTAEWDIEQPTLPIDAMPVPSPDDSTIVAGALQPLLAEIRATLIAFEDDHEVEITAVRICGGTARLGGLDEVMAEDLGVPVTPVSLSDERRFGDGRLALALAMGARVGGPVGRVLDFRLEEFTFKGDLHTLRRLAVVAAAAVILMVVGGTGWFGIRWMQLNSELTEVGGEIAMAVQETFPEVPADKLDSPTMALAIMQEKTTATADQAEALGALVSDTPPMTGILKEFSDGMPPHKDARIDVRELSISPTSIITKAETEGFNEAALIESSLQQNPRFKRARKGDEKKVKSGVRFTITVPLGEEEEE